METSLNPFFSVVIPLYNKAEHIRLCLNSVLNQTFTDFEIIVVNDGSTDNSLNIVLSISSTKIRIIDKKNEGVSSARNVGIREAKGKFVAFLDADDYWLQDFLGELHQLHKNQPNAAILGTNYYFEQDAKLSTPKHHQLKIENGALLNYFEVVAKGDMVFTASSCAILNSVFQTEQGFSFGETIGEDQDVWARMVLKYPTAFSNKNLAVYKQDASQMATKTKVSEALWPFIDRIWALAKTKNLPQKDIIWLQKYLGKQAVGQASQLIVSGNRKAGRKILEHPICRFNGLRFWVWKILSYMPMFIINLKYVK